MIHTLHPLDLEPGLFPTSGVTFLPIIEPHNPFILHSCAHILPSSQTLPWFSSIWNDIVKDSSVSLHSLFLLLLSVCIIIIFSTGLQAPWEQHPGLMYILLSKNILLDVHNSDRTVEEKQRFCSMYDLFCDFEERKSLCYIARGHFHGEVGH